MRRAAWAFIFLNLATSGCTVTEPARPQSSVSLFGNTEAILGDNVVQLDLYLIECPLGDLYINKDIWEQTDNQILDFDTQAVLDRNGFRVGQLVGGEPEKLHELMASERTCPNPRRRVTASGSLIAQTVAPLRAHCAFTVFEGETPTPVTLDDVECMLDIQATLIGEVTRLRMTPKAQYGQIGPNYQAGATGWAMEMKKPAKTFPATSWEVDLKKNDVLVVGALLDRQETIGFHSFIDQGLAPKQRLLVIRAHGTSHGDEVSPEASDVPLAQRAVMATVRANNR